MDKSCVRRDKPCLAKFPDDGLWYRGCVKETVSVDGAEQYRIFFADHGDFATVQLQDLKIMAQSLIDRLPFQAIGCSLYGVGPVDSPDWSDEASDFLLSLTRRDDVLCALRAQVEIKYPELDAVTNGSHYSINLYDCQRANAIIDLAEEMIDQKWAIELDEFEDACQFEDALEEQEKSSGDQSCPVDPESVDAEFDGSDPMEFLQFLLSGVQESEESGEKLSSAILEPIRIHSPSAGQLPIKSDGSRYPSTKWSQDEEQVVVTISVIDLDTYQVQILNNRIKFDCEVGGNR